MACQIKMTGCSDRSAIWRVADVTITADLQQIFIHQSKEILLNTQSRMSYLLVFCLNYLRIKINSTQLYLYRLFCMSATRGLSHEGKRKGEGV